MKKIGLLLFFSVSGMYHTALGRYNNNPKYFPQYNFSDYCIAKKHTIFSKYIPKRPFIAVISILGIYQAKSLQSR